MCCHISKETAGDAAGEAQRRSLYYDPDESSNDSLDENSGSSEEDEGNKDGRKSISQPTIRLKHHNMRRVFVADRVVRSDNSADEDLDDEVDDGILNRELELALAEITTQEEDARTQATEEELRPKKRRKVVAFRDDDDDTDEDNNKLDTTTSDTAIAVPGRAVSPAVFPFQPEDDIEDLLFRTGKRRKVILEDEDEEKNKEERMDNEFPDGVTAPLMPSGSESGVQSGVNTEDHGENLKITVEDEDNNENEEHIDKAGIEVSDDDNLLEDEINSVLREVERGMDEESERSPISAERNKPLHRIRILDSSGDSEDN
ncbi:unnamed protein product [Hymenolepis diminuta]|uniref:DUF4604 domain-containing protein n=1 Tax=Hymenolepis diminuta TaxID=6216 RepID=A0A0R3SY72_HYMDI|nr:unnamed protein product [Hymenolepis diminuta]